MKPEHQMVDQFWPAACQFPPKNIRGNEILFKQCPKIYDRKKKLVIRSETLVEGCKGWESKAYEFPRHKAYLIPLDSLFFLSFTKHVFRHPDLPASSPVRHFASGNLKARCGVAILALSRFNFAKAHTFYRYVRGGQQKLVHMHMCDLSPLFSDGNFSTLQTCESANKSCSHDLPLYCPPQFHRYRPIQPPCANSEKIQQQA